MGASTTVVAPGAGVALVTLFDEDGTLLTAATAELATRLVEAGAASVLVAGSSGEFWALDDEERVALTRAVRAAVPGHVPVLGHVGGVPVERAAALAVAMNDAGVAGMLALPLGIAAEDLASFYGAIVDAAGVPVLAYHLPQAGANVALDVLGGLGVAAIKDSSGDGERLAEEVLGLGIETYTGAPTLLGLAHDIGAAGAILGIANVRPELARRAFGGDRRALRDLAAESAQSSSNFPAGLKDMTSSRWGTPAYLRTAG
jgi:4-hydroxy-tetrahydrodipicolinate synthase